MNRLITVLILGMLVLSGCSNLPTGFTSAVEQTKDFTSDRLAPEVAKLPLLNTSTVTTFEHYVEFADSMNALIKILNEQADMFNVPYFEATSEGWEKALLKIEKYTPLVNNYNEVVSSAKAYDTYRSEENFKSFYLAAGKFTVEATLVIAAVYYGAAYKTVGVLYRFSGLNRLALKCGSCVSVILSQAHWTLRTVLVEGTSQFGQKLLDQLINEYDPSSMEYLAKNSTVT